MAADLSVHAESIKMDWPDKKHLASCLKARGEGYTDTTKPSFGPKKPVNQETVKSKSHLSTRRFRPVSTDLFRFPISS